MSEISILDSIDGVVGIVINGWTICDIHYDDDLLIKHKEDAVELAKAFVDILEEDYGDAKESDYPNKHPNPPKSFFVEGYESPNCMSEDEFNAHIKDQMGEYVDKLIDDLFCDCCD